MEKNIESILAELEIGQESFDSFMDNASSYRFRKATSDLYFSMEHIAKALLLAVGVDVSSHEGVKAMLGLHFIKGGDLEARVGRHLGNLHERRVTAEYSRTSRWEFTEDEIWTYLEWFKFSAVSMLSKLKEMAPEVETVANGLTRKVEQFQLLERPDRKA